MALCKIMMSMRQQLRKVAVVSTQLYRSESTMREGFSHESSNNQSFDETQAPNHESRYQFTEEDYKNNGLNEIFLTGILVSDLIPISEGRGFSFYVDIPQSKRDGGVFRVRAYILAYGNSLTEDVRRSLDVGTKLLVKGRLGSRLNRSLEGNTHNNFVVARGIHLL